MKYLIMNVLCVVCYLNKSYFSIVLFVFIWWRLNYCIVLICSLIGLLIIICVGYIVLWSVVIYFFVFILDYCIECVE